MSDAASGVSSKPDQRWSGFSPSESNDYELRIEVLQDNLRIVINSANSYAAQFKQSDADLARATKALVDAEREILHLKVEIYDLWREQSNE